MEETKQNLNILDVLTLYIDFFKCQGNYFLFHSFLCFFIAGSLEKAMAPHCSTLAWKVPWMEEPGGLQSMGSRRVRHDWETSHSLFNLCIGEGNGNPLQCSCLENPRYGVAQSRSRVKWLSSIVGSLKTQDSMYINILRWYLYIPENNKGACAVWCLACSSDEQKII